MCEICGIAYQVCNCFLEYTNFKDHLIEYKFLNCNKNDQQMFNEKLFNEKSLFNLINHQPDIDKIYLYAKDPYEAKYQFLINKQKKQA